MLRSIEWQQQTIAENEERFHGAIHEAPIPIMITGDSGEVVELNRARQDITAYTMDEVRTMASWSSLAWNEEDAALPEAGISRLRREKSGDNRRFQKPLFQLNLSPLLLLIANVVPVFLITPPNDHKRCRDCKRDWFILRTFALSFRNGLTEVKKVSGGKRRYAPRRRPQEHVRLATFLFVSITPAATLWIAVGTHI